MADYLDFFDNYLLIFQYFDLFIACFIISTIITILHSLLKQIHILSQQTRHKHARFYTFPKQKKPPL